MDVRLNFLGDERSSREAINRLDVSIEGLRGHLERLKREIATIDMARKANEMVVESRKAAFGVEQITRSAAEARAAIHMIGFQHGQAETIVAKSALAAHALHNIGDEAAYARREIAGLYAARLGAFAAPSGGSAGARMLPWGMGPGGIPIAQRVFEAGPAGSNVGQSLVRQSDGDLFRRVIQNAFVEMLNRQGGGMAALPAAGESFGSANRSNWRGSEATARAFSSWLSSMGRNTHEERFSQWLGGLGNGRDDTVIDDEIRKGVVSRIRSMFSITTPAGGGGGRGGRGGGFGGGGSGIPGFNRIDSPLDFTALLPGGQKATGEVLAAATTGVATFVAGLAPAAGIIAALPEAVAAAVAPLAVLGLAFDDVGKAIGGNKKAFEMLAPAQQKFVLQMRELVPVLNGLKQVAGESVFPGLNKALKELLNPEVLQAASDGIRTIGQSIGAAFQQWGKFLGSQEFVTQFRQIVGYLGRDLQTMTGTAITLFHALGTLMTAFAPLTDWMLKGIDAGARWVDTFLAAQSASGGTAKAIDVIQGSMRQLGAVVGGLADVIEGLYEVLKPLADKALPFLTEKLHEFGDWLRKNAETIRSIVIGAFEGLGAAIQTIWPWVEKLWGLLQKTVEALGGFKTAFEAIFLMGIATKLGAITGAFFSMAGAQGIGAAVGAIKGPGGLLAALRLIPATVPITIAITAVLYRDKIKDAILKGADWIVDQLPGSDEEKNRSPMRPPGQRGQGYWNQRAWELIKKYPDAKVREILASEGAPKKQIEPAIEKAHEYDSSITSRGARVTPGMSNPNYPGGPGSTGYVSGPGGKGNAPTPNTQAGLVLPATFASTHGTSGLEGFPALDVFAKPDTVVGAPADGVILRISGHDPRQGSSGSAGVLGWSVYLRGYNGYTYFMTHFATVSVMPGTVVRRGDPIGTVAYHPRGSHIHIGAHEGAIDVGGGVPAGFTPTPIGSAPVQEVGGPTPWGSGYNDPKPQKPTIEMRLYGANRIARVEAAKQAVEQAKITDGVEDDVAARMKLNGVLREALKHVESLKMSGKDHVAQVKEETQLQREITANLKEIDALRKKQIEDAQKNMRALAAAQKAERQAEIDAADSMVSSATSFKEKAAALRAEIQLLNRLILEADPNAAGPGKRPNKEATALIGKRESLRRQAAQADADARVLALLGLDPDGSVPTAGMTSLRKALDRVQKAIHDHHVKLSKKQQEELADLNKALAEKSLSPQVRALVLARIQALGGAITDKWKSELAKTKTMFENTWARLADNAMRAFESKWQAYFDKFDAETQAWLKEFDAKTSAQLTESEAALQEMQQQDELQGLQDNLTEAQKNLQDAMSGQGTPDYGPMVQDIKDIVTRFTRVYSIDQRQSAVLGGGTADYGQDLLRALRGALGKQPQTVQQEILAAQKQVRDAQRALTEYFLRGKAAAERKKLDAENEKTRQDYENMRAEQRKIDENIMAQQRDAFQRSLFEWHAKYLVEFWRTWKIPDMKAPEAPGPPQRDGQVTYPDGGGPPAGDQQQPSGGVGGLGEGGQGGSVGGGGGGGGPQPAAFRVGGPVVYSRPGGTATRAASSGQGDMSGGSTGSANTYIDHYYENGMEWLAQFVRTTVRDDAGSIARIHGRRSDQMRREGRR